MKKSKRLVFFGNERLATGVQTDTPVLKSLLAAGYDIAALVVNHSPARSRKNRVLEIAETAKVHKIPVIKPAELTPQKIQELGVHAAVLVAYGQIVPKSIIEAFSIGIINIHPSRLPEYRGPTPVEQAILDGKIETGVSLMKLAPKMDAGPVYAQTIIKLSGEETKQQLAEKLLKCGADLLIQNLPAILNGSLKPMSQNDALATYTKLITKQAGVIDWRKSIYQIEREIRAYAGWPSSRTKIWNHDVIITKAHAVPGISDGPGHIESLEEGALMLHASDGYICVDNLKPAGKNEMSAADFIRGYGP